MTADLCQVEFKFLQVAFCWLDLLQEEKSDIYPVYIVTEQRLNMSTIFNFPKS